MTPVETETQPVWQTVSHVIIGLKTTKGTKQLKLDPVMKVYKEKGAVGDVIYIEATNGGVKRVGRSDAYATEFDLEAESMFLAKSKFIRRKR